MENLNAKELAELYGYWQEHPQHPWADWKYEVSNGDTRQGYWEWVEDKTSSC